jgi:hypothetical protein
VNDHALSTDITNCVFKDNEAKEGAALVVDHGSPRITGCLFERNTVGASGCQTIGDTGGTGEGGAIWIERRLTGETGCTGPSAPVISNCRFLDNTAEQGGAIWAKDSNVTIEHCVFQRNAANAPETYQQGCFCNSSAPQIPTVEGWGGAIFSARSSGNAHEVNTRILNCTFGSSTDPVRSIAMRDQLTLTCKNRHGDIRLRLRGAGVRLVEAENSFGDIEVEVPRGASARLEARSTFGTIRSTASSCRAEDDGIRAKATSGSEDARLRLLLENEHGDIRVAD